MNKIALAHISLPVLISLMVWSVQHRTNPGSFTNHLATFIAMHFAVYLFTSDYNIYTDPNVTEVTKCCPILNDLIQSVNSLLDQWPDHPILNQVAKYSHVM